MRFFIGFLSLVLLAAPPAAAEGTSGGQAAAVPLTRFQYTHPAMGVWVRIVAYAPTADAAERACAAAFRRFSELDAIMSDYREESELMCLCAQAGGAPVHVSDDLFHVLERSLALSQRSAGAFDVTVGPYVALWRTARKERRLPSPDALEHAAARVGWRKLRLDPEARTVQLLEPGMRLDLGGIAKGYACDCAQAVLQRQGITRALVEAGGDIVTSGPPPGRKGWRITVPGAGPDGKARTLELAHRAVSSSGDTAQFLEVEGRRYSHVVDPRTGRALTNRVAVTLVAPDGITADSLATAAGVLGLAKGPTLVETYPNTIAYIRPDAQ